MSRHRGKNFLCVALLAAACATVAAQEPAWLEDGGSREYEFRFEAGQYARIDVEQHTIDVVVACLGPDGKQVVAVDAARIGDPETVELIASVSGTYRLRITPAEPRALRGRYEVRPPDVEPATERHKARIAAARAFALGVVSGREHARDAMLGAISHLQEALAQWRAAGDRAEEAKTLYTIGSYYIELGDREKAGNYTSQALEAARAARDQKTEGRALIYVAQVMNQFGDKRRALALYEEALPLMRAACDRAGEGGALSEIGVAYSGTGEKRKALQLYGQATDIFRELQDRRKLAEVANNAGVTHKNLAEYQAALENHLTAIELLRHLGDRANEAAVLNNVGSSHAGLGAYQKALDAFQAALEINETLDNRWHTAVNLNNIAWVHVELGDLQRALTFYQQALDILRAVKDQRRTAITLNNIAANYAELGNYAKAIELHTEVLGLRRAVGDTDGEGNTLNNLGKSHAAVGEHDKARNYLERALAIHRKTGNRYALVRALRYLGGLDREAHNYAGALTHLNEAIEISRAIRDQRGEGEALADLARVERDRGNFSAVRDRAEEALSVLEQVRKAVVSPALRATLFAYARDVQELQIAALMRLHREHPDEGFGAAALAASERSRARSLLEMIGEPAGEIRRGVDAALLNRERELQRMISAKAEQQTRRLSTKHSASEAEASQKELDKLTVELEHVQGRIRETSPHYAALTQPEPLDLKRIQAHVVDEETVLLEYSLGTDKSFLWAVTPSAVHLFELPGRAEIESTAKRVYELLTARNRHPANEPPGARAARIRRADQDYFAAAMQVSRMLLEQAVRCIEGKRLLIVGEGVLQYLPFAALPDPGSASPMPLIAKHEIVMAPSASVLAVLREENAGRNLAPKAVAVLADPVFSGEDARAVRSGGEAGVQKFARLRFSRAEAEEIARLAGTAGTFLALDFDASHETALRPELGQYRVVHFATHSLLDNARPELSGVVLSLVDREGRPQNGFLRLYDIYNLQLGAELVVLSACQTALGEEIRGEGLIGLTRGFLYAGAPRVVASLWEIDDRATAEVMKRFYREMLGRGERPAAAMRAAQLDMWRTRGWAASHSWGAFTLHGEWR